MSLSRMMQWGMLAAVVLSLLVLMTACDYSQDITTPTWNGVANAHLDGPADVVYLQDPATGYCFGIGIKYLGTMTDSHLVRCPHQGQQ